MTVKQAQEIIEFLAQWIYDYIPQIDLDTKEAIKEHYALNFLAEHLSELAEIEEWIISEQV